MKKSLALIIFFYLAFATRAQTFVQAYKNTTCGLSYVQATVNLNKRTTDNVDGKDQPATLTISGIPANAVIKEAYCWFSIIRQSAPQTFSLTNPVGITKNYTASSVASSSAANGTCWKPNGAATTLYRVSVLDIIDLCTPNGNYLLKGLPYAPNGANINIPDANGLTFFIVYQEINAEFKGTLYIEDGLDIRTSGASTTQYLQNAAAGINFPVLSADNRAFLVVSDVESAATSYTINYSQQQSVAGSGPYVWNYAEIKTTFSNVQSNVPFGIIGSGGDCYALSLMGIYFAESEASCKSKASEWVNAGADDSLCGTNSYQLKGTKSAGVNTIEWKTKGSGTFNNANNLNATYTCSASDFAKGSLRFYLYATSMNGFLCLVPQDSVDLSIQNPCLQVLGIQDLQFSGKITGVGNSITWKDDSEKKKKYILEKLSAQNNVIILAENTLPTFTFIDKNLNNIENEYRLKCMNTNGAISYSNIIVINNQNTITQLQVYISSDNLHVQCEANLGIATIEILNNLGKPVFNSKLELKAGSNSYDFELDPLLQAGFYIFRLRSAETFITKAFIKSR